GHLEAVRLDTERHGYVFCICNNRDDHPDGKDRESNRSISISNLEQGHTTSCGCIQGKHLPRITKERALKEWSAHNKKARSKGSFQVAGEDVYYPFGAAAFLWPKAKNRELQMRADYIIQWTKSCPALDGEPLRSIPVRGAFMRRALVVPLADKAHKKGLV